MKITVLGCGTSGGVPMIGNHWGDCDPNEPKNRRRRVSVLVEAGDTAILIDTSPDLREQALDAGINRLDGVLYTHDHADHTHGIDDLRMLAYRQDGWVDVYGDAATLSTLNRRFDYIFEGKSGYPAICREHKIAPGEAFSVAGVEIFPFVQGHGSVTSLGFRIGDFAYSTDLNALDDAAFAALEGVELWVVDALRYKPHPTHAHLEQTLAWIERLRPSRAVLTHMTWDMDYATLKAALPAGVEPGYDGMVIEV